MERERENSFKSYSTAVDRYNEAKSKSLIDNAGVKLMIKGQPSAEPESSKTLIIIALAMFGCGAMCVGVIVLMEFFDYRIKTPDKFLNFAKLKLLGYIHEIDPRKMETGFKPKNKVENLEVESVRDSLRKIRFAIENTESRVILVSSPGTRDGKTFVIVSLAKALSLMNRKILIIDTNFKNTTLTKHLVARPMLQAHSELKLLKASDTEPEDYTANIISYTNDKNIDIIGSSTGSESPSEIFAGRDFTSMIASLRRMYDYIFMEGASLNDFSDTRELIQYADGMVAVFSAKSTLTASDRESIRYMKTLNGKFLGAVLNQVNKKDVA
jgi:polysaccharide biosynthesis transport protein